MRAMLAVALLMAVPFTGCLSGDDDGEEGTLTVSWVNEPQDATIGDTVAFSWSLGGPEGEIAHTGVHWGTQSVSDPESPSDYPNAAGVTEPAQVPGTYDASVEIDEPGTYHLRAHAIADGEHVWSDEVEITVAPGMGGGGGPIIITIAEAPSDAGVGDDLTIRWDLTGVPGEAAHTGFHWGTESVEDPQSPADYGNNEGVREPATVPGAYNASFTVDAPGTIYGRAHAIKDGQHYWSREVEIDVTADNGTMNGTSGEHTVEMLDVVGLPRFSPETLTVHPGDTVTWVNAGQLDHTATFDDDRLGDSGDVTPGGNWTLVIPADLEPGEYGYVCIYHEGAGMVGTLVVEADNGMMSA